MEHEDAWQPQVGIETENVLRHVGLTEAEARHLSEQSLDIVRRGIPPQSGPRSVTGLVVGYVQSGKTMSFTTVAAICRDSLYHIIIVIAGTSIPLYAQSRERLLRDLGYRERAGRWIHFSNPRDRDVDAMRAALNGWLDPTVPMAARRTLLITVMKNAAHIRHLNNVLSQLNLAGVTAIVVDDEADQAGLNTQVMQNRVSATNRTILDLRGNLPAHVYLEYTATPQALLLIQLIDSLSPDFAVVLDSGEDYVGLREFFVEHPELVSEIPANELPTPQNALAGAPPSFRRAVAQFFVGVAQQLQQHDLQGGPHSMLVHPSRLRAPHGDYFFWAGAIKREWTEILQAGAGSADYADLERMLREAYESLRATFPAMYPFDDLMRVMRWAINDTHIEEVNAGRGATPIIDWDRAFSFILVGGQAMDRGFTVRGLTVTYMPRPLGVGNADTVQQRARFLGYKRSVLGLCRVYLEHHVADAYRSYEEHEADMREQLEAATDDIRGWRRRFILSPDMSPTRRSVLRHELFRGIPSQEWLAPRYPQLDLGIVRANRLLFDTFAARNDFNIRVYGHDAFVGASLGHVLADLLVDYRLSDPRDSQRYQAALLQLQAVVDRDAAATCDVLKMSGEQLWRRQRGVLENGSIRQLFFFFGVLQPRLMKLTLPVSLRMRESITGDPRADHGLFPNASYVRASVSSGDSQSQLRPLPRWKSLWLGQAGRS